MKRSKRAIMQSPSSSTPALSGHAMELSPLFGYGTRDLDTDYSGTQTSPFLSRSRLSALRYSPLGVDVNLHKSNQNYSNNGNNEMPSPDGTGMGLDLSDRSIGKGYLSDHLHHSLSYAKHMEQRAHHISTRISQSINISMSPRLLFSPDACNTTNVSECVSEYRKKISMVDDLNMHSYLSISQQTTSAVERYARLADVCPDLLNRSTINRFMTKFTPGERFQAERPAGTNPIFNCCNLAGSFSNLIDISRTRLAVLYKARHRLSGVLYCLKRSRCDFEVEYVCGSSSSEMVNEVQALSLLQHSNIIRFYASWNEADSVFIQLEYCLGGSLFHFLHPDRQHDTSEAVPLVYSPVSSGSGHASECAFGMSPNEAVRNCLSESLLIVLMAHVLSALHYIHTSWSMVHGDIKPSNILIQLRRPEAYLASSKEDIEMEAKRRCCKLILNEDASGILFKLSDFGRASRAGEDRDGEDLGDGRYLPRLNDPSPPARAATGRDIYALGITLYYSAGGPMSSSVWEKLRETDCIPDLSVLPYSLMPIVKSLLTPLAQDRPTAAELVNLPLLRNYINVHPDDNTPHLNMDFEA